MAKTTKKDFELFKKECRKWQEILGLKDWYFDFEHDLIFDSHEACASMDLNAMQVSLILSTEWEREPTEEMLKLAAFHEICEVLLGGLSSLGTERFNVSREDMASEVHRVIQRLTYAFFPKY